VRHAEEVIALLPEGQAALVTGDTDAAERDRIITEFKEKKIKFLVNVSVLTTGFDAPHVDLIALLRPTESASLFQQIVGRGLRLAPGKADCLVLDYTGMGHDVFHPEIEGSKPSADSVPVHVDCPLCGFVNDFWGLVDDEGTIVEHFGRKCRGATEDPDTLRVTPCPFRFRFKTCDQCGAENDIAARVCEGCDRLLVDNDKKLREAMSLKDAHVMRPDSMVFDKTKDKRGNERLEVRYYDADGQFLREFFYLGGPSDARAFHYNFLRMHLRVPEKRVALDSPDAVLENLHLLRMPLFVIARKKQQYWQVREKIFD
jgi:DNA repair protein RadD